jgi:Mn2+/Fe2+ NRAMP family transporter
MRLDVIVGMATAVVIMFAILVVTASTLGAKGVTNIQSATQAADALRPIAGPLAGRFFSLGIVGTGALAVPVLAGSTGYALAEVFAWNAGLSKTFEQARGFYIVIIGSMFLGLLMNVIGLNPIQALVYSAVLNGLTAPPLMFLMLLVGNNRRAVRTYRSGWLSNTLVGLACVLMTLLPLVYLIVK